MGQVYTIAGQPTTSGYQNGAALSAIFNNPYGVAYDASGILYITDQLNNVIRTYDPAGDRRRAFLTNTPSKSLLSLQFRRSRCLLVGLVPLTVGTSTASELMLSSALHVVLRMSALAFFTS
jgi:hypothetical protein